MIRPMRMDDQTERNFVLDGWVTSYRETRDLSFVPWDRDSFAKMYWPIFEQALTRCSVLVHEDEMRHGFIAFEPESYVTNYKGAPTTMTAYVLYTYVAQPFRGFGFARELFEAAGIDPESRFGYAARTRASWEMRAKIPSSHYDPRRSRIDPATTKKDERYERRSRHRENENRTEAGTK